MVNISVAVYTGWLKDYIKFEEQLLLNDLRIINCAASISEVSITVFTRTEPEQQKVKNLASVWFVNSAKKAINEYW